MMASQQRDTCAKIQTACGVVKPPVLERKAVSQSSLPLWLGEGAIRLLGESRATGACGGDSLDMKAIPTGPGRQKKRKGKAPIKPRANPEGQSYGKSAKRNCILANRS